MTLPPFTRSGYQRNGVSGRMAYGAQSCCRMVWSCERKGNVVAVAASCKHTCRPAATHLLLGRIRVALTFPADAWSFVVTRQFRNRRVSQFLRKGLSWFFEFFCKHEAVLLWCCGCSINVYMWRWLHERDRSPQGRGRVRTNSWTNRNQAKRGIGR